MTFGRAITTVFRNYAQFGGVASRSEYWWFALFSLLVSLALSGIDGAISGSGDAGLLATLWGLGIILPSLAVTVRRLRDAGYAWGYLFLALIPFLGAIILIVLLCQPSTVRIPVSDPDPEAGSKS